MNNGFSTIMRDSINDRKIRVERVGSYGASTMKNKSESRVEPVLNPKRIK